MRQERNDRLAGCLRARQDGNDRLAGCLPEHRECRSALSHANDRLAGGNDRLAEQLSAHRERLSSRGETLPVKRAGNDRLAEGNDRPAGGNDRLAQPSSVFVLVGSVFVLVGSPERDSSLAPCEVKDRDRRVVGQFRPTRESTASHVANASSACAMSSIPPRESSWSTWPPLCAREDVTSAVRFWLG